MNNNDTITSKRNGKDNRLINFLLSHPERILVAVGLIFLSVTILLSIFWRAPEPVTEVFENSEPFAVSSETSVLVDINTADVKTLMKVPGIGETLAGRIVEYREFHGDFESVEDLILVDGIGEGTLDNIKYYVKCS